MPDLEDEHRALQEMHDVEHRKEVELEKERYGPLPDLLLAELREQEGMNVLPSEHFIRCEPEQGGCGASFRRDLDACPICNWSPA